MKRKRSISIISLSLSIALFAVTISQSITAYAKDTIDFPDVYPESAIESISDEEVSLKVEALINTMTKDEMYAMLGGKYSVYYSRLGFGTGYLDGVPRLGVPVIRMWDGPKGVIGEGTYETTSPVCEIGLASSFSRDLAYDYGDIHGKDNRSIAGNVQLGIQVDQLRTPIYMRSRDTLGEDPYLTAMLGKHVSKGIEDNNVVAVVKHMAGFTGRITRLDDNIIVNEQTLHELYLPAYEEILKSGSASAVMTSYNLINNVQSSANSYLQKNVLRDMWNFDGMTMTDWGGNRELTTHLGTDIEMGWLEHNVPEKIEDAIVKGVMTWDDVENAVRHTLTTMGKAGYLGLVKVLDNGKVAEDVDPPTTIELSILKGQEKLDLLEANDKVALESAVKGAVLLKNDNKALPADKSGSVAMIGLSGMHTLTGHYAESSFGWLKSMTSPYENMVDILGKDANVTAEVGVDIIGENIPADNLYTDKDAATKGVILEKKGVETTINALELTTGSDSGDLSNINRTYKNSADGNALVNGEEATLTSYLKPSATGEYEFKLSGIGGKRSFEIQSSDGLTVIAKSGELVSEGWGLSSAVRTPEGMDIPKTGIGVTLNADETYKIVIKVAATTDSKDSQVRLTWFTPNTAEENYQNAIKAAKENDTVIIFAHDVGGQGIGYNERNAMRTTLDFEESQLSLIKGAAKAAKESGNKVIVVMNIALPMTMDWINDVDAVLNMWLPGQAGGKATAQLLTGEENPSGKLSVTFPKAYNQTPYEGSIGSDTTYIKEGIFCGYRWYDQDGIDYAPLYSFGHGLSYTDFEYSDLKVERASAEDNSYNVTFSVKNTGSVAGSEVAQVYLGEVEVPNGIQMSKYSLAQFHRFEDLQPGESREVTVPISERSLSYWNSTTKVGVDEVEKLIDTSNTTEKWTLALGERTVYVGGAKPDGNNNSKLLSQTINVGSEPVPVHSTVSLDKNTVTLNEGENTKLTATVTPEDKDITMQWISDDETIASVNQEGVVTAVKAGKTNIRVLLSNGESAYCEVTVLKASASSDDGSQASSDDGSQDVSNDGSQTSSDVGKQVSSDVGNQTSSGKGSASNPKTGDYILIFSGIVVLGAIGTIFFKRRTSRH